MKKYASLHAYTLYPWLLWFILTVILAVTIWIFSVDLYYHDQIPLVADLFSSEGPLDQFFYLYARHYQGLAYVIWGWTIDIFGNDARIASWIALPMVSLGTAMAIWIVQKSKPPELSDMLIPFILLNARFYETLFSAVNPSHGSFPFLLIMGIAACLYFKRNILAYSLIAVQYILLIFSGFGFIMVPVMGFYIFILMVRVYRQHRMEKSIRIDLTRTIILTVATVVGLAMFFYDYQPTSALACFDGSINPIDQAIFGSVMMGHVFGIRAYAIIAALVGIVSLLILTFVFFRSFVKTLNVNVSDQDFSIMSMFLIISGFTLLFTVITAYGRACQGVNAAFAGRYMAYMIPVLPVLYIALKKDWFYPEYFHLSNDHKRIITRGLLTLVLIVQVIANVIWAHTVKELYTHKMIIVDCIEGDWRNIPDCQRETGILVYLNSDESLLEYLSVIYGDESKLSE